MPFNEGFEYRERLGPEAEGQTLLAYLSRRYRHSSASEWRTRIEREQVLLDAKPAHRDMFLRPGQVLVWRRPPWDEPEAPTAFSILFEDDDLLAVAKPAGLPTLPGANFLQVTLLHRVRLHAPDAAPLHRLGRWTSGVVLFSRRRKASEDISRQWAERLVLKRYRALAEGDPSGEDFTVGTPIGPVPHLLLGSVHASTPAGKPAWTHVSVLERRVGGFLCDVRIRTGRPHQIRIHLAAAGFPLVGDPLYLSGGLPAAGARAVPGDPGYHLHAAELTFRHPRTARTVAIACAPPSILDSSKR
jgi:23S rRNA pseudouridine1911/1915/1917 synthase